MSKKIVRIKSHYRHSYGWIAVVAFVTFLPVVMTSQLPFAIAMVVSCLVNLLVLMISGYVLLQIGDFK